MRYKPVLAASAAALAVQPLIFGVMTYPAAMVAGGLSPFVNYLGISLLVIGVAALHLLVLGLPGFYLLRRLRAVSWWSMALLGFCVGAMFIAVFSWPQSVRVGQSVSSLWHGSFTPLVVDGQVTTAGWLSYLEGVALFGVQGMAGSLAFLAVWRRQGG